MADVTGSGYMGDATGGIGQGLAFVLPEGKTAAYAIQLAQTHGQQLRDLAAQKLQIQLKAAQQYEKDFKDQELPNAFAPFDAELNKRQNAWMQDGAKEYATTGKNPYNDPKFIARHNDEVVVPARKSLELGQNYSKLRAIAETDQNNKYTKESKQAVIDYQKQMEEHPFDVLDKPLPRLVETPASVDDMVKTLKQSGDEKFNRAQAYSAAMGDPKWHDALKSYGYNPDLPDGSSYHYQHDNKGNIIPSSGVRVFHTDQAYGDYMAKEWMKDPNKEKQLQDAGIDVKNDPYAEQKIAHLIIDQNDAMNRFVNDASSRLLDPEKKQQLADQKHTLMNQDRDYNLRVQEHADLQAQRKWANEHQHGAVFTTNILYGGDAAKQQSYESLKKLYESNPNYRTGLKISDDGQFLNITVPPRKKKNPVYDPRIKKGINSQEYIDSQPGYTVPPIPLDDEEAVNSAIFEVLKNVGAQNIKSTPNVKEVSKTGAPTDKNNAIKGWNQ